ncbi:MAG: hypothetical protein WBA89_02715 [Microcoleus sp.]|uniref:hypothetical protein n=1 Tax=Microcoleus sp. TaxID=44472 RepID=UPI003C792150
MVFRDRSDWPTNLGKKPGFSQQLQGSTDRNATPDPSRILIALDRTNCTHTETGLTRQVSGSTHRMLVPQPGC